MPLSLDLRERILASYDKGDGSRQEIADRYQVSLGMVKKLLQLRRHTGDIGPRNHRSGRKPMILPAHQRQMRTLLSQKPHLTLKELRTAVGLDCSVAAIHYALMEMGLSTQKKPSAATPKRNNAKPSRKRATKQSRNDGSTSGRRR